MGICHAIEGGILLNKAELITEVAQRCNMPRKDAEQSVNAVMDVITEALVVGDKVQLVGFGTFSLRERAARMGINPATKEPIEIQASKTPIFKAGKALKDAVK